MSEPVEPAATPFSRLKIGPIHPIEHGDSSDDEDKSVAAGAFLLAAVIAAPALLLVSGRRAAGPLLVSERRAAELARAPGAQMAVVSVADFSGASAGPGEEVALKVAKSGAYVVHRKVVAEQANMRLGTATAKTRAEVRGGGRKPYQQKGTGRARRGSTRSPLLVGGGKSFGPRVKSYALKMNKKEKRLAISTALMSAVPRMTLVQDFEKEFALPKTANMRAFLERLGADTSGTQNCLVLTKERHENTYLSARNIPYLNLMTLDNINARDVLRAKKVVVTQSAMGELRERYGEKVPA
jgi:large subunit ribosomal protein L4